VTIGANGNTPQTTQQKKYQFRDDFSWHLTRHGGLGHDFKVGANFIKRAASLHHLSTRAKARCSTRMSTTR